jgi:hypothetical protein
MANSRQDLEVSKLDLGEKNIHWIHVIIQNEITPHIQQPVSVCFSFSSFSGEPCFTFPVKRLGFFSMK